MTTIRKHKSVQECNSGEDVGSDYKWAVWLKEGWEFSSGRSAGTRTLFCDTIADFKYADPVQVK